eukprot:g6413.t1
MGYDYYQGNPLGDPKTNLDPGFRAPVVQLKFCQDGPPPNGDCLSRDVRDLQPTNGWAAPKTSCAHASSASESSTMSEYEAEASASCSTATSVEAEGGGWGVSVSASAAFSGSQGYNSYKNDVVGQEKTRVSMTSYCIKYTAGLEIGSGADLEPVPIFKNLAGNLPSYGPSTCPAELMEDGRGCVDIQDEDTKVFLSAGPEQAAEKGKGEGGAEEEAKAEAEATRKLVAVDAQSADTKWTIPLDDEDGGSVIHAKSGMAIGIDKNGEIALVKGGGISFTKNDEGMLVGTFKYKKDKEEKDWAIAVKSGGGKENGFIVTVVPGPEKKKKVGDTKKATKFMELAETALSTIALSGSESEDDSESGAVGVGTSFEMKEAVQSAKWMSLFDQFGTHFIVTLDLGGKMVREVTMTKASKDSITSAGVTVAQAMEASASVSASGFGISGSVSGSHSRSSESSKNNKAANSFANAEKEEKTIV